VWEMHAQRRGLLVADARGQAVLSGLAEFADERFHPGGRLAFAENNFRKSAAGAAVQVEAGETQLRHRRRQTTQRRVDAETAGLYFFQESPHVAGFRRFACFVHAPSAQRSIGCDSRTRPSLASGCDCACACHTLLLTPSPSRPFTYSGAHCSLPHGDALPTYLNYFRLNRKPFQVSPRKIR